MPENEEFRVFLINELKESGYTDETEGKTVEALQEAYSFQKKLNKLNAAKKGEEEKKPEKKPESKIKPIDMSRENAMAFQEDIMEAFLRSNAWFDDRIIDDERFKLNVHVTTSERPDLTMVLRDEEGRCC